MKNLLLITFISLLATTARAQQNYSQTATDKVYGAVEKEPSFPGGPAKLNRFLTDNIKPTGDKGRIIITFVVEKDGSLSDIKIVRGVSERADKEATDALSKSPDWIPGTQNGKPVRVQYTIPIGFN